MQRDWQNRMRNTLKELTSINISLPAGMSLNKWNCAFKVFSNIDSLDL